MGPRDQTQVFKMTGKLLYICHHFASPLHYPQTHMEWEVRGQLPRTPLKWRWGDGFGEHFYSLHNSTSHLETITLPWARKQGFWSNEGPCRMRGSWSRASTTFLSKQSPDEMRLSLEEWFSTNFSGICGKQLLQWWSGVLAAEDRGSGGSRAWQRAHWATLRLLRGTYKCLCGWIPPGECACVHVCVSFVSIAPHVWNLGYKDALFDLLRQWKVWQDQLRGRKLSFGVWIQCFSFSLEGKSRKGTWFSCPPAIIFCQRGVTF